jgi:UDP-3-O-[3-hydroxymyristoyl] glucosamine N-acyltransferase
MKFEELAARLGLETGGAKGRGREITGLGAIESAGPGDLAYVAEARLAGRLAATRAGAVVCSAELAAGAPVPCLVSESPAADFARATRLLHPRHRMPPAIDPTAVVSASAQLGTDVRIGPYAVVGDACRIGDRVEIHAHAVLYHDVEIGDDTLVYAGCVLREGTRVGARSILQPNVVLGSDGFGFGRDRDGRYEKIEQTGIVVVEEDVEIGAGSTVDRATFGETRVARGTKIDNLVQIGHNSTVGEDTILCAQVGLAGSTRIGRGVTLAGQVGVAGHLEIGDGAIATAQTGIPSSVAPKALVSGYPAIDNRAWLKSSALFQRLPDLQRTVRRLEARLAELEARLADPDSRG